MPRLQLIFLTIGCLGTLSGGCSKEQSASKDQAISGDAKGVKPASLPEKSSQTGTRESSRLEEAREALTKKLDRLDLEYPNHGTVTGIHIAIRPRPEPGSEPVVGWLRQGAKVRIKPGSTVTAGCKSGWYKTYPKGFVCVGQGVRRFRRPIPREELSSYRALFPAEEAHTPSAAEASEAAVGAQVGDADGDEESGEQAVADQSLPYRYFFVRDILTPEYHRTPTKVEQEAANKVARRYLALLRAEKREQAEKLRTEGIEGEPPTPRVVRRYLERGFYVAGMEQVERSSRKFVKTPWGSFVRLSSLIEKQAPIFHGVELGDDRSLPLAFARRATVPRKKKTRASGKVVFVKDQEVAPLARHSIVDGYVRTEHYGNKTMHVLRVAPSTVPEGASSEGAGPTASASLSAAPADSGDPGAASIEDERYVRGWFLGIARLRKPPRRVRGEMPWVHVSLSEQVLVLYEGKRPVFVTLVSSGLREHETPTGIFEIRKKFRTATMSAIGADAGDDQYRIEDVPWTQYFSGAIALHGAFWHDRFGLQRSHGCVNLAPMDAEYIFKRTWPQVPEGWHGVSSQKTGFKPSIVVVDP